MPKVKALLESEGTVCYGRECEKKLLPVFRDKVLPYWRDIPIIEGTEHHPFSSDEIIGVLRNMGIDGKWLHAEKVDWFLDRVQDPKTKQLIIQNKDIPGSMSDFVTIDPNTHEHIDQVPLHFLIHANLNPRIKGAGIKGNCILKLQKVRNMADQEAELEKLREQVAQMKRDNEELQTQITDAQEAKAKQDEADKADLFAKLLATGKFTEEELKSWTLPQAKAAFFAINKTATPQGSPKPNPAMQLAGNAGAGEKPASVWDLYKEKQRNNALAPYTNWSGK